MKILTGLLFVITMSLLPGCGSDSAGDPQLSGTWKYTQVVTNGKEAPAELLSRAPTVTFEGNKMIKKKGDKVVDTWTYKIDATQDPKRLTITMGEPGEEKDYHSYYTIEGDTLTTCHANKKFSNPFNIQLEPGAYFTVYTRVKE
jgi:uncharacterized protein (TIGR03067 family)